MTTTRIYFATPSGEAFTLSVQKKRASLASHGMYRAEIDARHFAVKQSVTNLLDFCLRNMSGADCLLVGISASPTIAVDANFLSRIGENRKSVIYLAKEGLTQNAIAPLESISYGEFFLIGCAGLESLAGHISTLTDIDAALTELGNSAKWAIGYDAESAVFSVLAREEGVAKGQIVGALEFAFSCRQGDMGA